MSKAWRESKRSVAEEAALSIKGFEVAVSELMKATGLKKGGIYRHFSSKKS